MNFFYQIAISPFLITQIFYLSKSEKLELKENKTKNKKKDGEENLSILSRRIMS